MSRTGTPVEDLKPLTSLRFAAAAMIVMLHAMNYFPWASIAAGIPLNHGVSFFFVLSGFILTHVYSQRTVPYTRFLWARFARLWPVHLVTCLMVLAFIRPDSRQLPGTGFFDPWVVLISNLTLTQSLVPFINYTFSWNSVSWSISTEMFFYLAFPFLLINIRNTWPWKLALSVALITAYTLVGWAFSIPHTSSPEDLSISFLTYASPLFRALEFVLGMASWVVWQKLGKLNVGKVSGTALELAALIAVGYWLTRGYFQVAPYFQFSITPAVWYATAGSCWICAILIVVLASGRGVIGQSLSWRPLVWLGEISFALYMVHQIVMKWFYLYNLEGKIGPAGPITALGSCILGAAILHHLVEIPVRKALLGRWKGVQICGKTTEATA